ncbi:PLP-dependent aminotransferase family protein [Alcaligenes faecalis]|uniref:MocR-like pyridoxine biosynthesis transcription factor PdxR n=1 Tax=Alcaligenes faecalis TaxID=511 RepID=UPI000E17892C|nr:PLP-dependent aminotransferase family protein [Alcaligenes faecalis]QRF90395.1 DNA-binding protein [Alcaligenes faecalis]SSY69003.1 HTH-type transcriptional regulatory protein gabR [Alcaligenes faecalis subsp. faecalis]
MDLRHWKPSREPGIPVYQQLYERFRDAIAAGQLRPGDRVPSIRSLASELNVAKGTVEQAYQILLGEGYFQARGPAGTVVSPQLASLAAKRYASVPASSLRASPYVPAEDSPPLPFQLGLPALDAFPRKTWARLANQNQRSLGGVAMRYPDPVGYAPLRRAIAAYLGVSRGIACLPEQIFVTAGYWGALELVCRSVLNPGDAGWYENPGYIFARQFLKQAGMHVHAVPLDEDGLNLIAGQQHCPQARFAIVTPTHQSPMGMAMSLPRRLQLLEWARQQQAWIVEDDYDSEFRYHGRPLPALKSLDRDDRVIYTGTFSKVLNPGLRLAYLVAPLSQVERFQQAAHYSGGPGSILTQATVADFMEQGYFARHLRKMRALYAKRRAYLVQALQQILGERLQVQSQAGGIHVLANLRRAEDDRPLAKAAQEHGLAVQALSDWQISPAVLKGLLMGFANISDQGMADEWVERLSLAIAEPS